LDTRFINSQDGARIAYDVIGTGPAVMLLHGGFVHDRSDWRKSGYVDRLKEKYTVISVDLRGHGESDRFTEADRYIVQNFVADLEAVADACNATRLFLWGFSFGGTIALNVASKSGRISGIAIGGVWFGKIFTAEMVDGAIKRLDAVVAALDDPASELSISPAEREMYERTDPSLLRSYYQALGLFPAVEPEDLLCPALLYCGTDNPLALSKLRERETELAAKGVELHFFEGLTHMQEFSEIETVFPVCSSFLARNNLA
jgi:pimeloyl-ACP methyl ester carboxylesterase